MNILVCDDDREICEAIKIYLTHEGYNVLTAHTGIEAIETAKREDLHLVIMDVMMPGMDGLRATLKIRESNNVPILMLSAKTEDTDKILGLGLGADDYMSKPYNPLELTARVKSLLRRYTQLGSREERTGVYQTGGLMVDDNEKSVTVDGEPVHLTPMEYGIINFLIQNAGRVYSIEQIYENVWQETAYNPENTVAVHIRRIREKIEINPREPKYIKVVWGIGYKIDKI